MQKRLKIFFITTWYPNSINPMQGVFIREHAKAVNIYDDVIVLHLGAPKKNIKFWSYEEETDRTLTEDIPTYHLTSRKFSLPGFSYLLFLYGIWQLFRKIRKGGFNPDILHANIYSAGVPAVMLGKVYRIPVVITEQSSVFPRKLLSKLELMKARFAFSQADKVLPISKSLQTYIESYSIKANFEVIPNSYNPNIFFPTSSNRQDKENLKLLFVGNLISIKGLHYLINAIYQIHSVNPNITLDVIGDGILRDEFSKLVNDLQLQDTIFFHGYQTKATVSEYMRNADLFVLPSLVENLGCVLIEAMACGLPLIASNVGGISEIINDENGLLTSPGDAEALANTLLFALSNLSRFDKTKIIENSQTYTSKNVGLKIHQVYKSLIS